MTSGLSSFLYILYIVMLLPRYGQPVLTSGLGSEDEERLIRDIFKGYNQLIRPVRNNSETLEVKFGLAMIQIINVDEKNQIMKSNVWLEMQWVDYQLSWEPAEYGGIASIRLPSDKVWKPDIVLYNNADGRYEVSYKPNVVIYRNGVVLYVPPAIYKSSCTIDVQFFPFDEQLCKMKFGSWTFNGDEVVLDWFKGLQQVDINDYVISGAWDLLSAPGFLNHIPGNEMQHSEVFIRYEISIRRKTLFYTVNLITPCVLISFLSVLMFYLPAEAGEKITLGISILLSLAVFLLLVSKILPPTSQTLPLIAKYLLFTFIMNIISIVVTVVIIAWNFRGPATHKMPEWVRVIFLRIFPKILFMKRPPQYRTPYLRMSSSGKFRAYSVAEIRRSNSNIKVEIMELSDTHHPNCKITRKASCSEAVGSKSHSETSLESVYPGVYNETHKAAEAVEFISTHLKSEDDEFQEREDWKYVAMVIDRLQLYVFFGITAGGTIGLLLSAPHIFESVDQEHILHKLAGKI